MGCGIVPEVPWALAAGAGARSAATSTAGERNNRTAGKGRASRIIGEPLLNAHGMWWRAQACPHTIGKGNPASITRRGCGKQIKLAAMGLMEGRRGLVVGVANDHSYAWFIAESLVRHGATCLFTHLPGEKMERR